MAITLTLIAITVAVSLFALYGNRQLLQAGMLRPYRTVRQQTWYEVISSGFLHAGIVHLVVNMFVLFIFGAIVEEMLGEIHFTALYFSGLVVSALPSLIRHREDPNYATLGASGAVQAVLFGYIFMFPTNEIILIFLPVPMPAWLFGVAFLGYSIYDSKKGRSNVNHEAHIAGAIWGILYLLLFF